MYIFTYVKKHKEVNKHPPKILPLSNSATKKNVFNKIVYYAIVYSCFVFTVVVCYLTFEQNVIIFQIAVQPGYSYWMIDHGWLGIVTMDPGWFMVFNATFNDISVISWRPVLFVEEIENTWRQPASRSWLSPSFLLQGRDYLLHFAFFVRLDCI